MMYGNPVSTVSDCVSIAAYMFAKIMKVRHTASNGECFLFCSVAFLHYLCIR